MSAGALPWRGRRLHFVGFGGAGMSGYARLARALGAQKTPVFAAVPISSRRYAHPGYLAIRPGARLGAGRPDQTFHDGVLATCPRGSMMQA